MAIFALKVPKCSANNAIHLSARWYLCSITACDIDISKARESSPSLLNELKHRELTLPQLARGRSRSEENCERVGVMEAFFFAALSIIFARI